MGHVFDKALLFELLHGCLDVVPRLGVADIVHAILDDRRGYVRVEAPLRRDKVALSIARLVGRRHHASPPNNLFLVFVMVAPTHEIGKHRQAKPDEKGCRHQKRFKELVGEMMCSFGTEDLARSLTDTFYTDGIGLPVRELNVIVAGYACTFWSPLPEKLTTDQKGWTKDIRCWGELCTNIPIGTIGILHLPGCAVTREAVFIVVHKPANADRGMLNVVFLKLQKIENNPNPSPTPLDLSDDIPPVNRFRVIELAMDPQYPLSFATHLQCVVIEPTHTRSGGRPWFVPLIRFIDLDAYTLGESGVLGRWRWLSGLAPKLGISAAWTFAIRDQLNKLAATRTAK